MPQQTSPFSTPTGMPGFNPSHKGKYQAPVFTSFAQLVAALTPGTDSYSADLWDINQQLRVATEPASGYRVWNGTHARTYFVGGFKKVLLGSDTSVVRPVSGAPAGSLGSDGDLAVDETANSYYGVKASGTWGSSIALVTPSNNGGSGNTAAVVVAQSHAIPLDTIGSGKIMTDVIIDSTTPFTLDSNPVEGGNCTFMIEGRGVAPTFPTDWLVQTPIDPTLGQQNICLLVYSYFNPLLFVTPGKLVDRISPALVTAVATGANLRRITLTMSEAVNSDIGPASAFVVANHTVVSFTKIDETHLALNVGEDIAPAEALNISYAKANTGFGNIRDYATPPNEAANFGPFAVTNGVLAAPTILSASFKEDQITIVVTMSEAYLGALPAVSAFASTGHLLTAIAAVTGAPTQFTLTTSTAFGATEVASLSYTAPGTNPLTGATSLRPVASTTGILVPSQILTVTTMVSRDPDMVLDSNGKWGTANILGIDPPEAFNVPSLMGTMVGDGWIEFTNNTGESGFLILSNEPAPIATGTVSSGKTRVFAYWGGTNVNQGVGTPNTNSSVIATGDKGRIWRVGSVVTYRQQTGGTGAWNIVYTYPVTATGTYYAYLGNSYSSASKQSPPRALGLTTPAPTIRSFAALADGLTFEVYLSDGYQTLPPLSSFSVVGHPLTAIAAAVTPGSPNRIRLTTSTAVVAKEATAFSYSPGANPIRGIGSGLPLAAVTSQMITNLIPWAILALKPQLPFHALVGNDWHSNTGDGQGGGGYGWYDQSGVGTMAGEGFIRSVVADTISAGRIGIAGVCDIILENGRRISWESHWDTNLAPLDNGDKVFTLSDGDTFGIRRTADNRFLLETKAAASSAWVTRHVFYAPTTITGTLPVTLGVSYNVGEYLRTPTAGGVIANP